MKRMSQSLCLVLLFLVSNCTTEPVSNELTGSYQGEFLHKDFSIDLQLDIEKDSSGYEVYFTSLGQKAYRIPTADVSVRNDSLFFALRSDFFTYQFNSRVDTKSGLLKGELLIDEKVFPFQLDKTRIGTKPEIEELTFSSNGLKLSGSLWKPQRPNGMGFFFVTSSGNQDRSGSNAEARYFSQKGFTVFHFDKRGTGRSEGNLDEITIEELSEDDIAAILFFGKTAGLELSDITILGSSQGAAKVPLILNSLPQLKGGIMVSAPGCTLLESDLNFTMNRIKDQIDDENLEVATSAQKAVFEYLGGLRTRSSLEEILEKHKGKAYFEHLWLPELTDEVYPFLSYSPLPHLEKLQSPVLIIQGTSDIVIPENSIDKIVEALTVAGNDRYTTVILEGADHSMTKQQSDFQYWSSLHPQYFQTIENWLKTQ